VTIERGRPAPAFRLWGVAGTDDARPGRRQIALSDYAGTTVVLVFYPADNSPVCTVQLSTYSADIGRFADVGAQVLAISPQGLDEHEAFAAAHGPFAFPLLSDVDKEVGRAYDILGPVGFSRRSVIVVDGAGTVQWAHRATAGLTFRPVEEIVDVVAALT
jgi:peroxiredoxin Q/BCP